MSGKIENIGPALEVFERIRRSFDNSALLNRLGLAAIRFIKSRTRRGIDVDGVPFRAYSERWAKIRKAEGLPTSYVNLEFDDYSGMLQRMDHVVANDLQSVTVLFTDDEKDKIAGYHSYTGAGRGRVKRPFFFLSRDENDQLRGIVQAEINLLLNNLNLSEG